MIDKRTTLANALDGLTSGMTIMVGGWGACAIPTTLIRRLAEFDVRDLTIIHTGVRSVGPVVAADRVRRVVTSFASYARGERADEFAERYSAGRIEAELCSQGILAERIRAGGAGVPAFYVERRFVGSFALSRLSATIDGKDCVLQTALRADFALVRATQADTFGNLRFDMGDRNFNAVMARAADVVVAEAGEIVPVGQIHPETVVTPGIFVTRLVPDRPEDAVDSGAAGAATGAAEAVTR
jgi:3-oxoacid CoA-transferase A subunit